MFVINALATVNVPHLRPREEWHYISYLTASPDPFSVFHTQSCQCFKYPEDISAMSRLAEEK